MIFSTILFNLIGLYDVDLNERKGINEFKQAHLYNEEYKRCAKLHHSTKIFGEPLNCINDTFAVSSLELLGGSSTAASSPDMIHFIRNLNFHNDPLQSIEIISNQQGQIIRVEAELPADATVEEMRSMAMYISKKHGQPDVTPPNPRMPLWGWITRDGFELRLFRDTSSGSNKFSITQRSAHETLRDLKNKEKTEEQNG
ncbi:TPA: hypothetical protein ACPVZG_003489 [Vibrio parahaemolyticus]|uniref:Uncharacterized protein n=1 Tax=Vibrio parahaemolyticus TaxID=670 RepID=A0AAW8Q0Q9_VIBPH|nr:hypothetical protein [Vibrio parahaemolyticus]MDS1820860.1 hypothetical protein [Vibrio parahaemolyticus]